MPSLNLLDEKLKTLNINPCFESAKNVVDTIIGFLQVESSNNWVLFNDNQGKIKSNAGWLMLAEGYADKRASYMIAKDNNKNIDFKVYWLKNTSKSVISWTTALTPNFEDEPFYKNLNIGIDFIIPEKSDKIIIILSKNYIIRTLELSEKLSITQQEIFSKWIQDFDFNNKSQVHEALWQSFDFEEVNKKFYKGISSFFVELKQYFISNNIFDEKHSAYFTNRLIGRIIFCWFLDKKGILNKEVNYFDTEGKDSTNYYRDKLEILFFQVLNTPKEDRGYGIENKTPFLNGGLFEVRKQDLFGSPNLNFSDDYFDRLFKFLRHYNFTTDESTSTYQQVAIDPEMLGRIFENLLAEQKEETGEQARKAKGAFYTPREIVDFMCKESIKIYLKIKIPEDSYRDERLRQLLDEPEHKFKDQETNWRRDWKPYKDIIIKALDEIKILDPACGSGAFPMGMLHLLLKIYERLETRFDTYKTKLGIIKNNIFGVDIEPMAIEISRLRAWLSIVVDESADSDKIKSLPNLDFKFVCANSLISLDKDKKMSIGSNLKLEDQMIEIRDRYFSARTHKSKNDLKESYNKLIIYSSGLDSSKKSTYHKQLESYHPFDNEKVAEFFDAKFMFGADKFDLVIGNPPYVQLQKDKGRLADMYKNEKYETFARMGDLYSLFYERGLNLSKENSGLLCFITSNKWMRAGYGEKLRGFFANKNPIKLLDFGGFKVFESATVDTNILLIQNNENQNKLKACHFKNDFKRNDDLKDYFEKNKVEYKNTSSDTWFIGDEAENKLKKKIEEKGTPLKDWDIKINYGIKTGCNEAFIIDEEKRNELIQKDPKCAEIIKPILRGRDIKKYGYEFGNIYILFIPWHFPLHMNKSIQGYSKEAEIEFEKQYPAIFQHLLQFKDKLSKRNTAETGIRYEWYALQRCANTYYKEFEKEKIVWNRITHTISFSFAGKGFFVLDSTFFITGKNIKYILGVINSKLLTKWVKQSTASLGEGSYGAKIYIENAPIPKITFSNQHLANKIEKLVDEILEGKKQNKDFDSSDLERQIDEIVYEIYDLTDEERRIIESQI